LLAAVIAIELIDRRHYRSAQHLETTPFTTRLQDANWDAFVYQLGYFLRAGPRRSFFLAVIALSQSVLQIRWRRWMTRSYLDHWLAGANITACSFSATPPTPGPAHFDDIRMFIESTPQYRSPVASMQPSPCSPFMTILWAPIGGARRCICSAWR